MEEPKTTGHEISAWQLLWWLGHAGAESPSAEVSHWPHFSVSCTADSVCRSRSLCFLLLWAGIRTNPEHEGRWCLDYQVYSLFPNQCLNCYLLLEETLGSFPQSQYLVVAGGGFRFEIQGLCHGRASAFFRERQYKCLLLSQLAEKCLQGQIPGEHFWPYCCKSRKSSKTVVPGLWLSLFSHIV